MEHRAALESNPVRVSDWHERLPLVFLSLGSVMILCWLMKYSHYGLDFTDESYYLSWAAAPERFSISLSQFGFVYHPLYKLVDGHVAHFRQANLLLTLGLAWLLAYQTMEPQDEEGLYARIGSAVTALGLACASILFIGEWQPTPSYNSLNLQGLIIVGLGALLSTKSEIRSHWLGLVCVGVGGWLVFMAKPSSAAAIAVALAIYWLMCGRLTLRTTTVPAIIACALLTLSALLIDGSIGAFIARHTVALESAKLLSSGHSAESIFRLDHPTTQPIEKAAFALSVLISYAGIWCIHAVSPVWRLLPMMLTLLGLVAIALMTVGVFVPPLTLGLSRGMVLLAIPSAVGLFLLSKALSQPAAVVLPRSRFFVALFFLAVPYGFAFGTNGNYWWIGTFAAFFWVCSAVALSSAIADARRRRTSQVVLALVVQVLSVLVVLSGMEKPYRQAQPIRLNTSLIDVGAAGSALKLSVSYADYLASVGHVARAAGFQPGLPVIDLTGQSPGVLYAMQARAVGLPWIIGGYPGSASFTELILRRVPCEELAAAWLLSEPQGPRSIHSRVLKRFAADMVKDYIEVGTWTTAPGAGGYAEPRRQVLLKPGRSIIQAVAACQATRNASES